ncbi:porin family protein [Pseudotenacibaculum haliotis]|uniref:Porin family protein n=1 Tax=Pseudotenacibaculum haliotis TaxID=1862138 RepID=A0ABW5LTL2_9FLAO
MKKLLFVMLLGAFAMNMNAQEVKLGLKTGLNIANIRVNSLDADSRTGFHFGAIAELQLTDRFSIQPEVLYSQFGAEEESESLRINYISIPIMAKYYIVDGFSFEAGPQFSFLANDELEVFSPIGSGVFNPEVNSFDLALNLGMGYQFNGGIFFQARYNLGLTNVQSNPDVKNGALQLSLGYRF